MKGERGKNAPLMQLEESSALESAVHIQAHRIKRNKNINQSRKKINDFKVSLEHCDESEDCIIKMAMQASWFITILKNTANKNGD